MEELAGGLPWVILYQFVSIVTVPSKFPNKISGRKRYKIGS